jgi:hypothetical protein
MPFPFQCHWISKHISRANIAKCRPRESPALGAKHHLLFVLLERGQKNQTTKEKPDWRAYVQEQLPSELLRPLPRQRPDWKPSVQEQLLPGLPRPLHRPRPAYKTSAPDQLLPGLPRPLSRPRSDLKTSAQEPQLPGLPRHLHRLRPALKTCAPELQLHGQNSNKWISRMLPSAITRPLLITSIPM